MLSDEVYLMFSIPSAILASSTATGGASTSVCRRLDRVSCPIRRDDVEISGFL
ncbi:hypothetical protein SERLA73DRAFT_146353, partial [Serpula lacrymans var. lacrymans S7.3]